MINYFAIYSIIAFRLKEFFSEYQYSLLAPITTNVLFILVFLTIESYYSLSIDSKNSADTFLLFSRAITEDLKTAIHSSHFSAI